MYFFLLMYYYMGSMCMVGMKSSGLASGAVSRHEHADTQPKIFAGLTFHLYSSVVRDPT